MNFLTIIMICYKSFCLCAMVHEKFFFMGFKHSKFILSSQITAQKFSLLTEKIFFCAFNEVKLTQEISISRSHSKKFITLLRAFSTLFLYWILWFHRVERCPPISNFSSSSHFYHRKKCFPLFSTFRYGNNLFDYNIKNYGYEFELDRIKTSRFNNKKKMKAFSLLLHILNRLIIIVTHHI